MGLKEALKSPEWKKDHVLHFPYVSCPMCDIYNLLLKCATRGQEPYGNPFLSTVMASKDNDISVCEFSFETSSLALSLSIQLRAWSLRVKLCGSQFCLFFSIPKRPIRHKGFRIPFLQKNRSHYQETKSINREVLK